MDATLIGSAALADGSKIVTYNKMPLYYWAKDTKAGDTTGQACEQRLVCGLSGRQSRGYARAGSHPQYRHDPKLGKILVGDKGMTLYMYTKDAA